MIKKIDVWLNNKDILEKDYLLYLKKMQILKEKETINLSKSHINKSLSNLNFSYEVLEKIPQNPDWAIISYYYAAYHAALSLISAKSYSSKSRFATICLLIKYYHNKGLENEDIHNFNELSKNSINDFDYLKDKRENASYGISINFETELVKEVQIKAIDFVNKAKDILKL